MAETNDNPKRSDAQKASPITSAKAGEKCSRRGRWDFKELIEREFKQLHWEEPNPNPNPIETTKSEPADEPYVIFTKYDHFGLALSGGGIRSATFNLGLLQGLDRNGVLRYVQYLSTVSGGGYVGGFWTAWLHAQAKREQKNGQNAPLTTIFPPSRADGDSSPERAEIRHLREFSRFLMPRVGFMQAETWSGIVTILAGMLPSILAAAALAIALTFVWFGLNFFWLVRPPVMTSVIVLATLTLALHGLGESSWRSQGKAGNALPRVSHTLWFIAGTTLIACGFWVSWQFLLTRDAINPAIKSWTAADWKTLFFDYKIARERWLPAGLTDWKTQLPDPSHPERFQMNWILWGPVFAWSLTAVVMMMLRFFWSRFQRSKEAILLTGIIDRCAYRCLAPAIVWAGAAGLWDLARSLPTHVPVGGSVVFGGLFLWLRDWLAAPIKETHGSRLLDRIKVTLKPLTPQLLAAAAVLSFTLGMIVVVQQWGLDSRERVWWFCGGAVVWLFIVFWVFNPARVGMHDFYRARIARCFLGAAWAEKAERNRATTEQREDDMLLCDPLDESPQSAGPEITRYKGAPIHLVCCAANNLAGDTLSSLYRGCRSAVLSPHGVSLGEFTGTLPELRYSSALTASAAAFNSQMGRVSMRLGPSVAIIMSALNLRLGLWVHHPLNPLSKHFLFPGRFFFKEMFGHTKCDPIPEEGRAARLKSAMASSTGLNLRDYLAAARWHLHLSDGGHFENLGLYELIRRHCRYVIVSDCSADPQIAFDDLANTLRCIREDFNVEIELDVSPLRPSGPDNRSVQHAVVGIIHYDGLGGTDKGTILYFKPTLTGDEPPDLLQYQTRNRAFPHESTGDQFYDEAQWESYRRLGEHAANVVLLYLQNSPTSEADPVENIFLGASQHWHPAPPRHEETFLQLTQRFSAFEAEIRDNAPAILRHEFFPEVEAAGFAKPPPLKEEDEPRVIYFVMLAAQVMEDAWLGCQLDSYWSHPLNRGWMTYFQRWASTPSFRRWWPILRPIYSIGFADFVKQRFNLGLKDKNRPKEKEREGAELELSKGLITEAELKAGMAARQYLDRMGKLVIGNRKILEYKLTLEPLPRTGPTRTATSIQVGFLLFEERTPSPSSKIAIWQSSHLFVAWSLVGAGIVARFLETLIFWFKQNGYDELQVIWDEERPSAPDVQKGRFRRDPASRQERLREINFYKSRRFAFLGPKTEDGLPILSLKLTGSSRP